jgi:hypothetical protein
MNTRREKRTDANEHTRTYHKGEIYASMYDNKTKEDIDGIHAYTYVAGEIKIFLGKIEILFSPRGT